MSGACFGKTLRTPAPVHFCGYILTESLIGVGLKIWIKAACPRVHLLLIHCAPAPAATLLRSAAGLTSPLLPACAGYRNVVGLPGGVDSPLFPILQASRRLPLRLPLARQCTSRPAHGAAACMGLGPASALCCDRCRPVQQNCDILTAAAPQPLLHPAAGGQRLWHEAAARQRQCI